MKKQEKQLPQSKSKFHDEHEADLFYMQHALLIAQKAYPAPNPQVGAVIVKNNMIIGEGFHEKAGAAHAEIQALKSAEQKRILPDGATMYVTLEPCCHFGKTPPCVDAIVVAGIKRIVIGCRDENELVNGNGITALIQAGITVNVGILGKECAALYKKFFHTQKKKRPYATLKTAMTLDGKIAPAPATRATISSPESHYKAHELRRDHDAILTGIGTILSDDPLLNCRIPCKKQPIPVILDSKLKIHLTAKVLQNKSVIIATTKARDKKKQEALEKKGVRFIVTEGVHVALKEVFKKLPELGILSVLIEGGAEVNAACLEQKFIDRICFFIAPKIYGTGVPVFETTKKLMEKEIRLTNVYYTQVGKDICVEADIE
ncbi:bifunctional diaminohydroxyphosphoribosylaminopyrimidine deaminase/5-amino-6-(5-phosphoribosylamino)uracil reductase RibD [Candidatus Woesearchaeota archaeon]|nr:bifunctional diaminohydroxyphosphoribosylaminopyrimidine deaminase/5-amino-6-(5-phosphoribosylamino)uracil reductase RibD [Candidatus Woesearchaeota archaeon]